MDFVLMLHSHLPYVLHHGRWPHGSDWLCEAALDTYLPLLDEWRGLEHDGVPAPLTIGFTPVLANQLASPAFAAELDAFFEQRLAACDEAAAALTAPADAPLAGLVPYWRERLLRLHGLWLGIDRDIVRAFRRLAERGAVGLVGSAATHAYLPLLARDESVRLQLALGRAEHARLFGEPPAGCWLPECAYRPGLEDALVEAGFTYFFTDAHLARAGLALGAYADVPLGAERFDAERHDGAPPRGECVTRTPYRAYRVPSPSPARGAAVLVRDPQASLQVWSRQYGYPGDEWYLEFHKIRWPGGLKLWRVTGSGVDLGGKRVYEPHRAAERAAAHAEHFARTLARTAAAHAPGVGEAGVMVAPFDTELFGHWWHEGVEFLGGLYRRLRGEPGVRPVTATRHLRERAPRANLRLARGSWGANGDDSMWQNDRTAWTWERLHALEHDFWDAAPAALTDPAARPVLAQAARELLLAQASDWQFIISTGVVADYGERRFNLHCRDAERLVAALRTADPAGPALADELRARDDLFPDVLASVARVLAAAPVPAAV